MIEIKLTFYKSRILSGIYYLTFISTDARFDMYEYANNQSEFLQSFLRLVIKFFNHYPNYTITLPYQHKKRLGLEQGINIFSNITLNLYKKELTKIT